jgi:hypothetical protein
MKQIRGLIICAFVVVAVFGTNIDTLNHHILLMISKYLDVDNFALALITKNMHSEMNAVMLARVFQRPVFPFSDPLPFDLTLVCKPLYYCDKLFSDIILQLPKIPSYTFVQTGLVLKLNQKTNAWLNSNFNVNKNNKNFHYPLYLGFDIIYTSSDNTIKTVTFSLLTVKFESTYFTLYNQNLQVSLAYDYTTNRFTISPGVLSIIRLDNNTTNEVDDIKVIAIVPYWKLPIVNKPPENSTLRNKRNISKKNKKSNIFKRTEKEKNIQEK